MRILQISTGVQKIPPDKAGSPEGHITLLSKQLVKMGHEVTILDRKYASSDPSSEQFEGIEIIRLSAKYLGPSILESKLPFLYWLRSGLNTLLFTLKINRFLKQRYEFEAINTYVITSTLILVILNKSLRSRIVYNHHAAFWPSESGGILNWVTGSIGRFTLKRIKKVILQNDSVQHQFATRLMIPDSKTTVLPPGIHFDRTPPVNMDDIKAKYNLENRKLVLFVGRINRMKGLEYLVKAADIIVNQCSHKEMLFLLVGSFENVEVDKPGKYTRRILDLVKSLNLAENVRLTGTVPLDDITGLYLICDLFVLPSIAEQFPLVVLEAMTSGKPVIASKTPGALMQVKDGWNGLLVGIGDEKELAEKIRYLLDNPEEAKRMGVNATEFVKQFDWSKIAQKYLEVYTR